MMTPFETFTCEQLLDVAWSAVALCISCSVCLFDSSKLTNAYNKIIPGTRCYFYLFTVSNNINNYWVLALNKTIHKSMSGTTDGQWVLNGVSGFRMQMHSGFTSSCFFTDTKSSNMQSWVAIGGTESKNKNCTQLERVSSSLALSFFKCAINWYLTKLNSQLN